MTVKIEELRGFIERTIPQVYTEAMSYQELLYGVLSKMNEVIQEVNGYFSEGIETHVDTILNEWRSNGKLQEVINQEVFGDIQTNIVNLQNDMTQNRTEMENNFTEVRGDITSIQNSITTLNESVQENVEALLDLQERNQKLFVSVRDFGAVGDGVTDDTEAIQNAINSTASYAGGTDGALVFFPPGTYLISDSIRVHGNTSFIGVSRRGSTLKLAPGSTCRAMILREGVTTTYWTTIKDICLDGQASQQFNEIAGILLENTTECLIENVGVRFVNGNAIHIKGANNNQSIQPTIRNCIIRADENKHPENSSGILLDGGSYDGMISGNDIGFYKKGYGIRTNGHNGAFMSDNNVWQCKQGFLIQFSKRIRFANNLSDYAQEHGYYIQGCNELQFTNCQSRWSSMKTPTTYDGFHFYQSSDLVMTGCTTYGGNGVDIVANGTGQTAKSVAFTGTCTNGKVYAHLYKNCGNIYISESSVITVA